MFLSMTGFGSKTVVLPISKEQEASLSVEIKTINSRFFEAVNKLPSFLSPFEIKIIQLLKEKLVRGRVYLTVRVVEEFGSLDKVTPSLKLLDEYVKAIKIIKKKFKISGDWTVSDVLRLPNVFISQKEEVSSKVADSVLKVIVQVADQVCRSRQLEGKILQKDLEKRFLNCSEKIEQIRQLFKKFIKKQKDEIKTVLALQQKKEDTQLMHRLDDLYSVLDKIDVHEEITRFNSHLENIIRVIKDKTTEKGKRIDFILQELVRESNTILAKCSNFEISSIAVDIKVELEKAREQSQNIV